MILQSMYLLCTISAMAPANSTRDRILDVATLLFARQGIRATTVAAIEGEAGLRAGSGGLHRHFRTKDDLVRAILERELGVASRSVTEAHRQAHARRGETSTLDDALAAIAQRLLDGTADHREIALILLRDAHNLPADAFTEFHRANFEIVYADVAANVAANYPLLLERGVDPEALAFLMVAPLLYHRIVEWSTGHTVLDVSDDELVQTWAYLFATLFESATPPAS